MGKQRRLMQPSLQGAWSGSPCADCLDVLSYAGCGAPHHGDAHLRHVLDERGHAEAGEARRLSERKALVAVERRGKRLPYPGVGKKSLVIEMHEQCFRPVTVEDHDGMLARSAERRGWIVLQFPYTDRLHVSPRELTMHRERRAAPLTGLTEFGDRLHRNAQELED